MWFVFAVMAASCFGIRGILYQWTSQRSIDRNLLLLGVYLSGTLITLAGNMLFQQPWSSGVWLGGLMGLFSFIANAAMYKGYAVGKASIVALFTGLPPLVVMIVAFILWKEALTAWQFTAFFIVLTGLILIKYSQDLRFNQLQGVQWGILAMLFFGFTDVSVKQANLAGASALPALTVMFATGSILFALLSALDKFRRNTAPPSDDPAGGWTMNKTVGWGMLVGITNAAGMMFLFQAFREGITGIVSAIVAMNVAFVIVYARFYLKEVWTTREMTGLGLAFVGILILRIAS